MKITSREIIIAAVAILVLLGIGYFINNNNNDNGSQDTQTEEVNLEEENTEEEEENTDESNNDENVESVTPAPDSTVSEMPDEITVKFKKAVRGGSEIKVVSAKGVDVVPGANILSTDRMTLVVPVEITESGQYNVAYSYCLDDGTCKDGTYKFTVE